MRIMLFKRRLICLYICFSLSTCSVSVFSDNNDILVEKNLSLADTFQQQNDSYKAMYYYQKVLMIQPDNITALYSVARLYFKESLYKKALETTEKLLEKERYNVSFLIFRARIYVKEKNWDSALTDLRKAESIDKTNPRIQLLYDEIYSSTGQILKAKQASLKFHKLNSDNRNQE